MSSRCVSVALVGFFVTSILGCGDDTTTGSGGGSGGAAHGGSGQGAETSTGAGDIGGGGAGGGGGAAPCVVDDWSTYGHDARRTSEACAAIAGDLSVAWMYQPAPPPGRDFQEIRRPIASKDAVYINWSATVPPYIGTTAIDRVSLDGARVWTFDSGTDANFGNWMTIGGDKLVAVDDAVFVFDLATGEKTAGTGVDLWGQTLFDGTSFFLADTSQADGPGLFVGAFGPDATFAWQANQFAQCGTDPSDQAGGIALDGGTLYYAPAYTFTNLPEPPLASGAYAFDAATGAQQWFVPISVTSPISLDDSHLYVVADGARLVALSRTDGSQVWEAPLTGPLQQAPLLTQGLVVIATQAGITAFHPDDGSVAWDDPETVAFDFPYFSVGNGCAGTTVLVSNTRLAAASLSSTIVATTSAGVEILDAASGASLSTFAHPTGGTFRDPVIVDHRVYVHDGQNLFALDAPP